MGGVFGGTKTAAPQVIEQVTPPVVDNSEKVLAEERARRKRRSVSSHYVAKEDSLSGLNTTNKQTLGA